MDVIGTVLNIALPVCVGLLIAIIARGSACVLGVLGAVVTVVWALALPGALIGRLEPAAIGLLGLSVRVLTLGLFIAAAALASRQRPGSIREPTAEPTGWVHGGGPS